MKKDIRVSDGSLRKRQMPDGSWQWQACINVTEDGKRRQLRKMTGVASKPLTDAERGSGKRNPATGAGAKRATEFLKTWRAELVAKYESKQAVKDQTVIEFCDAYWATKTNVADNTRKEYRKARNHIDHPALQLDIAELEPDDVQTWLDDKRSDRCGATALKKAFVQLKAACAWGVRMGHLKKNACDPIEIPTTEPRQKNPLDIRAIESLNTALDNLRRATGSMRRIVADAASLALLTGLREGEVCGLAWDDIDGGVDGTMQAGGYIHVRNVIVDADGGARLKPYPKSRKYRDIPMNDDIVALLSDRRKLFVEAWSNDLTGCYVLARPETADKFMSNGYLSHRWSDFIGMTGIVGMENMTPVFHDLRNAALSEIPTFA